MEAQKLFYYLKFFSIRSLFTGDKTKREILTVILVLISMRLVIYGAMSVTGFHPMNYLNNI
ncbi:MAG: hypothetical protein WCF28_11200 [Methanobacterium sp.]|uniref:hypothetical protein n=1 Tax=Methanobacterium sp. TaxID=2164 RepID=UPI003C746268